MNTIIPDSFVLIYGGYSPSEKLDAVSRIKPECGQEKWKTLLTNYPDIISFQDIAIVLNDMNASITFYFEITTEGYYEIVVRCFSPSKSSCYCQLNGMKKKVWNTSSAKEQQNVTLYSGENLTVGMHTLTISYLNFMALVDLTFSGPQSFLIPVINTFLYPNKRYSIQRAGKPDVVLPAINNQLYGATEFPFPYFSTPGPDLACYETATPQPSSPYIVLYGSNSADQKRMTVQQISTYCGRSQWEALVNSNPNVISGSNSAIIVNNPEAILKFKFWSIPGRYNIFLRCIMPSANTDSGFVRLDNMPEQQFTRGLVPLEYMSNTMDLFLFEAVLLTEWLHELVFSYKEPIGYIEVIVSRADARLPDIVIPAVETLLTPDKIFGDKDRMTEYMANLDEEDIPTQFRKTGAGPKIIYTYAPLPLAYPAPGSAKKSAPVAAKKVAVKPVAVKKVAVQRKRR